MKLILVLAFLSIPAASQPISFGIKGGVPLDRAGQGEGIVVDKPRWTVGPTLEVRLLGSFSIGVDALYRRVGYSATRNVGSAIYFEKSETSHWEIPAYAKYRFAAGPIRPFVTGGVAIDHARRTGSGGCTGDPMLCVSGGGTYNLQSSSWGSAYLFGTGVEFQAGAVKIAPEFRLTRPLRDYFIGSDAPALLVGIRF